MGLFQVIIILTIYKVVDSAPTADIPSSWCLTCPSGHDVIKTCVPLQQQTVCNPCHHGFYNKFKEGVTVCMPCSRCGPALYELHPCNATEDVFCELCSWKPSTNNKDYNRKCKNTGAKLGSQYKKFGSKDVAIYDDYMQGDDPMPEPVGAETSKAEPEKDNSASLGESAKPEDENILNNENKAESLGDTVQQGDPEDNEKKSDLKGVDQPEPDISDSLDKSKQHEEHNTTRKQFTYVLSIDTPNHEVTKDKAGGNKTDSPMLGTDKEHPGNSSLASSDTSEVKENIAVTLPNSDLNTTFPEAEPHKNESNLTASISEIRIYKKTSPGAEDKVNMSSMVTPKDHIHSSDDVDDSKTNSSISDSESLTPMPLVEEEVDLYNETAAGIEEEELLPEVWTRVPARKGTTQEDAGYSGGSGEPEGSGEDMVRGVLPPQHVPVDDISTTPVLDELLLTTAAPQAHLPPTGNDIPPKPEVVDIEDGVSVQASTQSSASSFSIIISALTAGVIFFALGYFLNTYRRRRSYMISKTIYTTVPTKPPRSMEQYNMQTTSNGSHMTNGGSGSGDTYLATTPLSVVVDSGKDTDTLPREDMGLLGKGLPPDTKGVYQSPIDIVPDQAELDTLLEKYPLYLRYLPDNTRTITNTGATISVKVDYNGSLLSGGPLGEKQYSLDHFHFHWGAFDSRGSEHTVSGHSYAAELHLVHWNRDDYATFQEAMASEDGLAVIAVFIKVGEEEHEGMAPITDSLLSIQYKGEAREIPHGSFDPKVLLPASVEDYWTYQGSLTTPPYYETVTWVVFKDPISISYDQMDQFRKVLKHERDEDHDVMYEGNLVDNYRTTQPLGDRIVRASFV